MTPTIIEMVAALVAAELAHVTPEDAHRFAVKLLVMLGLVGGDAAPEEPVRFAPEFQPKLDELREQMRNELTNGLARGEPAPPEAPTRPEMTPPAGDTEPPGPDDEDRTLVTGEMPIARLRAGQTPPNGENDS